MEQITFDGKLVEGYFLKRINRFAAEVEVNRQVVRVHVPSSGRMQELLLPGTVVLMTPSAPGGRTKYKLLLVKHQGFWVSVDSLLPNRLVRKALENESFPEITGYSKVKPEKKIGQSRFDFFLQGDNVTDCLIEVKSVTLVEDGTAMFPDAPSERGTRHIFELMEMVKKGMRAVVLFIVQRADASSFTPNWQQDRDFAAALAQAASSGVEVYAWKCKISPNGVGLDKKILVKI
ncbi:MAG: DNA/RNA nuclease SfsA [Desulfotomaculum sp.]|nr:DNA/RNA nuclease SfsA [Desulfotomaculum sp.]